MDTAMAALTRVQNLLAASQIRSHPARFSWPFSATTLIAVAAPLPEKRRTSMTRSATASANSVPPDPPLFTIDITSAITDQNKTTALTITKYLEGGRLVGERITNEKRNDLLGSTHDDRRDEREDDGEDAKDVAR
ncbi:hypothetical protein BHE74_00046000 [Ensete ventricosum]|nr:hypothetical protein BHE74_00046000 [Ensete ventricosum]RZS13962.1 hypothetical protein BHM03_00045605 [Ensete ventricosum]